MGLCGAGPTGAAWPSAGATCGREIPAVSLATSLTLSLQMHKAGVRTPREPEVGEQREVLIQLLSQRLVLGKCSAKVIILTESSRALRAHGK